MITSDVSLHGLGAVCQEVTTRGLWTTGEASSHINLLELKAAYLALQYFLKESVSTCFGIRLDNQTAISYLNHIERLALSLCQLALDIWTWCLAHQITLHVEYLPGTKYYSGLGIKVVPEVLHNICNMHSRDLPDMSALDLGCCTPSCSCANIRQITPAHVTYIDDRKNFQF